MWYSSFGVLALVIQSIINLDVFRSRNDSVQFPSRIEYRRFLVSLTVYYIIDAMWGTLYELRIIPLLWVVTTAYFASMAVSVFLWTRYVIAYLNREKKFKTVLFFVGWSFLLLETTVLVLNCFFPVVFTFAEDKTYVPCNMRYFTLFLQVLLYLFTAVYTLYTSSQTKGKTRRRCRTVGISGLTLAVLIAGQMLYPFLPLYAVGCLLGVCIMHTFVLEEEKSDYRKELEHSLEREKKQRLELESAKTIADTDPLTGVKSKYAFLQEEKVLEALIENGNIQELSVVVFDLNDLKAINDTCGHEEGDRYIRDACTFICKQFAHSPVYRIGGDEFVAILRAEDFRNRRFLLRSFEKQMELNKKHGDVVIATGAEDFHPGIDRHFSSVLEKADKHMYERKAFLKNCKD